MGQTLTHGIYLPDEGERNCYDGLASNWSILDGAVGTIAEHTTQIAGKAPAVHTHTKADITDFPAYGNTAGTICEGNDSRLSDARTPVAHTHTKSDITDLLNSNFIPSANNSYDLGSSSYQWKSVYAQTYYYNGTAWGLDKANVWSNYNYFSPYRFQICSASQEIGVLPSSNQWNGFVFADKNNNQTVSFEHAFMGSGETRFKIQLVDNIQSNESGTTVYDEMMRMTLYSGGKAVVFDGNLRPFANGVYNLGNSNQKWKTFNGVNPGALSLPNLTMQTYDPSNGWYDLDTTGWDLTGSPTDISSDMLKDGYLYVCLACDSTGYVVICEGVFGYPNCYYSTSGLPVSGYARALLPVRKGTNVRLYLKGTSMYAARLFPALGNV